MIRSTVAGACRAGICSCAAVSIRLRSWARKSGEGPSGRGVVCRSRSSGSAVTVARPVTSSSHCRSSACSSGMRWSLLVMGQVLANWLKNRAQTLDGAVLQGANRDMAAAHRLGNLGAGQGGETEMDHLLLVRRQLPDRPQQTLALIDRDYALLEPNLRVLESEVVNLRIAANPGLVDHRVV